MATSYAVKFWKTDVYRGARVTTYKVRWFVAQKPFKEPFRTAALAESFDVPAETVEGLDDAFGEALARHVADPSPSVLVAKAEPLVPPPTTSPNWYRKRR